MIEIKTTHGHSEKNWQIILKIKELKFDDNELKILIDELQTTLNIRKEFRNSDYFKGF